MITRKENMLFLRFLAPEKRMFHLNNNLMFRIRTSALIFFGVLIPFISFGQKLFDMTFVDGKPYRKWNPTTSQIAYAHDKIKNKFPKTTTFDFKKTITRLCYFDTVWGPVSSHLIVFNPIDTVRPYKSFLKVSYSYTKDSFFLSESYLFSPDSKKTKKILSDYNLNKTRLIVDSQFNIISTNGYIEMAKVIELSGSNTAFYNIDKYKAYSDKFIYTDGSGKEYIFLSFYNPTPDYEKSLYDNFLLLYSITENKIIMNFPIYGEW